MFWAQTSFKPHLVCVFSGNSTLRKLSCSPPFKSKHAADWHLPSCLVWTSGVGAIHHPHACHTQPTSLSRTTRTRGKHTHGYGHVLKCVLCFQGGMVPHWGGGTCSPVWSDAHHTHMGVVQSRCRIHHPAGSRNILLAEFVLAGVFTQSCVFCNQFHNTLNCAIYGKWARMWILMSIKLFFFFVITFIICLATFLGAL